MADDGDPMAMGRRPEWLRPANRPNEKYNTIPPPKSVLIVPLGFIDDEHNGTTAHGTRSDHGAIHVSFWIAHPPRVSYFTVDCPGQDPDEYPFLPRILAMDDDAVLIRVPVFGGEDPVVAQRRRELFLYQPDHGANTGGAKLRLLPDPNGASFADMETGLLRRRADDAFFVVAISRVSLFNGDRHKRYLHLFDSRAWAWDTRPVHVEAPESCSYAITHKVITVGGEGGSVAWVDLWHGILVYDVLLGSSNNNALRYIPLPTPAPRGHGGMPSSIRDIAVINGCIKYFRMYLPGVHTTYYITGDWEADSWKMVYPSQNWQPDHKFRGSDIAVDHRSHRELLPDGGDAKETALRRLSAGNPALGLHDNEDVVYVLAKAWVLAVNMRTKTLQGMAELCAQRYIASSKAYTQSEVSKYMGTELGEDHVQSEAAWTTVSSTKKKTAPLAGSGTGRKWSGTGRAGGRGGGGGRQRGQGSAHEHNDRQINPDSVLLASGPGGVLCQHNQEQSYLNRE